MRTAIARLTVVMSMAGGMGACKKAPPPPAPPIPTVAVVTVPSRSVPLTKEFLATLEGFTTAQIQPQVSGYIREVHYQEGSIVDKDQLLFTLDKRPFIAAVDKARGDHENAKAQLNKSKADVARYLPLVAEHAISKEQLDNARAAVLAARGNVEATKGALQTAKLNLEWAEVRSPIRGLAGLAQTRVGTLVNPNQVLTIVSTLDPVRASFNVSQQDYLQYADVFNNPNAPQYTQLRYFELLLLNGRVYPHRAREIIVNRQIDPTTGTLQVQALFPNPENLLRPGLFGRVRVHVGTNRDTPLVPEVAMTELQGQYQVSVIDDQQRVQTRQIKIGERIDHAYAVESGLRAGERVIVKGQQNAQPGAKVNVQQVAVPEPSERQNVAGHDEPADGGD
jgi:membrane fusion protein (multidrug efflux system)